jgi:hypothetical protein
MVLKPDKYTGNRENSARQSELLNGSFIQAAYLAGATRRAYIRVDRICNGKT